MIKNVKFRRIHTLLQNKLNEDIEKLRKEKHTTDKTNICYSISSENHAKLMRDNNTNTYKKSQEQTERNINYKAKAIAERLELADRIYILDSKPAYITLKDQKENFRNHMQTDQSMQKPN